jgi:exosome complex RNA-binding protein Rrp4
VIRENLKMAQMRQKSYHDRGTAPRHFEVGDYVYLKVSPTKGVQKVQSQGKVSPALHWTI